MKYLFCPKEIGEYNLQASLPPQPEKQLLVTSQELVNVVYVRTQQRRPDKSQSTRIH